MRPYERWLRDSPAEKLAVTAMSGSLADEIADRDIDRLCDELGDIEDLNFVLHVCVFMLVSMASLVGRQCLGKRRIPNLTILRREVRSWRAVATHQGMPIRWKFRVKDARHVFRYDALRSTRSQH
jgi:hypothetical protein